MNDLLTLKALVQILFHRHRLHWASDCRAKWCFGCGAKVLSEKPMRRT